jgi:hypothetical protein
MLYLLPLFCDLVLKSKSCNGFKSTKWLRHFVLLYYYSLPSEKLDVAAQSAATSNSWFYMAISLVGREYAIYTLLIFKITGHH